MADSKDLGGNAYELTANVDTYVDNHPAAHMSQ